MAVITIWHNPRCSKSRQTLAIIEPMGEVTIRKYLEDAPTLEELRLTRQLLRVGAIEMMRPKDALFRELGLSKSDDEDRLLAAMAKNPALIERPIVFANGKAAIGRPPETVLSLF